LEVTLKEIKVRSKQYLMSSDANKMFAACKAFAVANNWQVSIAIVDDAGYILQVERLDGAVVQSPEIAILKARTAAISRVPTKSLEDVVTERPATTTFPGRLPVQGGVPIIYKGECLGGIGVSGVKSFEDEQVAIAGLKLWSEQQIE
jgi:glc operon protein GlcG